MKFVRRYLEEDDILEITDVIEDKIRKIVKSLINHHMLFIDLDTRGYVEIYRPKAEDYEDPMSLFYGIYVFTNTEACIKRKIKRKQVKQITDNLENIYWDSVKYLRDNLYRILKRVYKIKENETLFLKFMKVKFNAIDYGTHLEVYLRRYDITIGDIYPIIERYIGGYRFIIPEENKIAKKLTQI